MLHILSFPLVVKEQLLQVRLESMVWASYIIMLLLFTLNTVLTKLDTHVRAIYFKNSSLSMIDNPDY